MTNIEVEVRSFVSCEKYDELKEFFGDNAELVSSDEQETHYFDCKHDLRIQKNEHYSKVWFKKGNLHDDAREEIEIKFDKDSFEDAQKLFDALGYGVEIKWFRKRLTYRWDGIDVMLDFTRGYGYILEMEILCDESGKDESLEKLKRKFDELGVEVSSKDEFKKKFEDYKKNWKKLTIQE
jgi:predicted adenylyl cyclase CyaB